MSFVTAPFTEKEVTNLNNWQRTPWVHPFTCANRSDGHRFTTDWGVLQATTTGWVCPDCDYRQAWAHDFMVAPTPPNPLAGLRENRV